MKNKKLKQKQRKQKTKITFPQQLQREDLFKCPIWFADEPGFVKDLNKASDSYIEESKKNLKADFDLYTQRIKLIINKRQNELLVYNNILINI